MFLVVGLGNPGKEYEHSPHNLGFQVVGHVALQNRIRVTRPDSGALTGVGEIQGHPVLLAMPQTFMNLSGTSVAPLMAKHSLTAQDLVVVYDDLDLPWTALRVRRQGSAGGHHGVESLIRSLGTIEFVRVRLGIHPGHTIRDGAEFVLAPFKRSQEKDLEDLVSRGADAVVSIIAEGVEKAMAKYNRRAQGLELEEA